MKQGYLDTLTLDLGDIGEHDVDVNFYYSPPTPDIPYLRNGDPGYPGDPAEVEILSVRLTVPGQEVVDLLPIIGNTDKISDLLLEKAAWY